MTKIFILNADDFGMTNDFNNAVLNGYKKGILTSASICANGMAFEQAISDIIPQCPDLSIGVHLNIIEGKSLTNVPMLTNNDREFNNGYISMIFKSYNKTFLNQIEQEFRAQIEAVISRTKVDHIDSHVHVHSIPNIFKIVVKLAKEYNIPYVRTQFEHLYVIPSFKKHFNFVYPLNIVKIIILNTFTKINLKTLKANNIKTNDYIIGVGYTSMMDDRTVSCGLKALSKKDCIVEALIHPCLYETEYKDNHSEEFELTQNINLKRYINQTGFKISNHSHAV